MATSVVEIIQGFFAEEGPGIVKKRKPTGQRFFRPAKVTADGTAHRAFTFNVSPDGIRLIHDCAISTGSVQIEIDLRTGAAVRFEAELLWCRRHGDHYLSGARFLEGFQR